MKRRIYPHGENQANLAVDICRYIPAAGRFLIVCTFIEDALRIMTQWSDQLMYLHDYRHSESSFLPLPLLQGRKTDKLLSTMGLNTHLPPCQRPRHVLLLHPRHHSKIYRIRRLRPHRRRRHSSPWLRSHFRPQLLFAQPLRHGRPPHGSLRQLGATEVRTCGAPHAEREGSQEIYSACGADIADFAVRGVYLEWGLGFRADFS